MAHRCLIISVYETTFIKTATLRRGNRCVQGKWKLAKKLTNSFLFIFNHNLRTTFQTRNTRNRRLCLPATDPIFNVNKNRASIEQTVKWWSKIRLLARLIADIRCSWRLPVEEKEATTGNHIFRQLRLRNKFTITSCSQEPLFERKEDRNMSLVTAY